MNTLTVKDLLDNTLTIIIEGNVSDDEEEYIEHVENESVTTLVIWKKPVPQLTFYVVCMKFEQYTLITDKIIWHLDIKEAHVFYTHDMDKEDLGKFYKWMTEQGMVIDENVG